MQILLQDLRYALRTLAKSPGFTIAAALTLALGIGASTALFTAVDALLLRPLPLHEPGRLVEVSAALEEGPFADLTKFSYPHYEALRDGSRSLTGLAAAQNGDLAFGDGEYAEEISAAFVTRNYFQLLGIHSAAGRLFALEDDRADAATAGVILSHRLWQRRFGGNSAVVGSTVTLNGHPVVVAGVAPETFSGTRVNRVTDLWAPIALHEQVVPNSRAFTVNSFALDAIGRLAPGVSQRRAEAEISAIAAGLDLGGMVTLAGVELREMSRIPVDYEGSLLRFVALLGAATTLVLLIAGVNVAGMLLVRGAGRRREIAVRMALGAGRGRVVRQLLTEGMLLFLFGGTLGVLLAIWLTDLLLAFRWPMPITLDLGVDLRVLGFALLLSLLTGVVFSLAPAFRASRPVLVPALKDAVRSGGRHRSFLRNAFTVGQVAMSLLLLVGAGLFLRALQHALAIDPGFNPNGVMIAEVDLHRQRYDDARGARLYDEILEQAQRVPGVEAASFGVSIPLGGGGESLRIEPVGSGSEAEPAFILANIVDPEYFRAMEIPLLRGRPFTDADRQDAPKVVIVNQTMAERYWPGQDPVGKRLKQTMSAFAVVTGREQDEPTEYSVVGVVPNVKTGSLREDPEPYLFVPRAQNYRSRMLLALRAEGDASRVAAAVQNQVHTLDPSLPLLELTPLAHHIGDALLPQRIGAILTSLFGLLGLLLTGVGIYGVMAYSVGQRTHEIGVRIALGARQGGVLRLVLGRGIVLTLVGIGLGIVAALAMTRFISSLLYGVSATDPVTFAGVTLVLALVALLAAYLPARRATRVDPMVALRAE